MENFIVNCKYKREEVLNLIGVPKNSNGKRGGVYTTGYFEFKDAYYLFVNINTEGRTGHNYNNQFLSDNEISWYAKGNAKINQSQIQDLLNSNTEVHLFYREDNRDDFTYAGRVIASKHQESSPIQIIWKIAVM